MIMKIRLLLVLENGILFRGQLLQQNKTAVLRLTPVTQQTIQIIFPIYVSRHINVFKLFSANSSPLLVVSYSKLLCNFFAVMQTLLNKLITSFLINPALKEYMRMLSYFNRDILRLANAKIAWSHSIISDVWWAV